MRKDIQLVHVYADGIIFGSIDEKLYRDFEKKVKSLR